MIYPDTAQNAIHEVISALRTTNDFDLGFNRALEVFLKDFNLDRALILQVSGDRLTVTHELSKNGGSHTRLSFSAQESTMMVLTMLSRNPDGADIEALVLERDNPDISFQPYSDAFKNISSHALVEIRGQTFIGFTVLQSIEARSWSRDELASLEKLSEFLAVITCMYFEQQKLISDYKVLETQLKISSLDLDSNDSSAIQVINAVELIANACEFAEFKLYLSEKNGLVDAVTKDHLDSTDMDNPFVSVSSVKRGSSFLGGADAPACFSGKAGLIIPIVYKEDLLGVFGMWTSTRHNDYVSPQCREIAITLAKTLSEKMRK
ncbi:MAG: hypothetical protein DKT66_14095 [Candidatus Melainabacteria bacterium]|nr:MAG: hypothetical protein DKT66_14095 [Candidatus Melainabacteria bacterium]